MNETPTSMTTQMSIPNRSIQFNTRASLLLLYLLLFSALLIPVLARASVTATVDRSTLNEGETFTLTLNVSGGNSTQPDLSGLHKDFDVLSTGQNSSIQIINGSVQSHRSWSIALSPQHTGTLTIPPITVGSEHSQALTITVLPATASTSAGGQQGDVFIEVSAKPSNVYVQQQLVYTVRLYYASPLRQATLSKPTLDNAIVQKLGKDVNFYTQRNGRQYQVIERRYAIFPQQSGTLKIPGLIFDGQVDDPNVQNNNPFFFGFNQATRHVHLRSRTIAIPVATQPATYHGANWLPAQTIRLEAKWSQPNPQFHVGEPITRDIVIHATGLASSQLPDLPMPKLKNLKLYPDQPQTHDTPHGNTLESEREQKIAMIPTQAGDLTLPEIHLTWWDTTTQQERTATLPAETVHVLPTTTGNTSSTATTIPAPLVPSKPAAAGKPAATISPTTPVAPSSASTPHEAPAPRLWIALTIFFAAAWLITLLLWWRHKHPNTTPLDKQPEQLVAQTAVKRVKQACAQNEPQAIKQALLAWAKTRWPATPPLSLGALARWVQDDLLTHEIASLDRCLYASNASKWQAEPLRQHFTAYLKQANQHGRQTQTTVLAPMYLHKTRAAAK
jgi:hypothetical protein